LDLWKRAN